MITLEIESSDAIDNVKAMFPTGRAKFGLCCRELRTNLSKLDQPFQNKEGIPAEACCEAA
ncbi:hypothetical protein WN943_003717 [Citrus x changshan-huyou]